jgi:hypothetical protein
MTQNRREFLVHVTGAVVAARTLAACGDDATPTPIPPGPDAGEIPGPAPNCLDNGANSVIVANHGHVLMVPAADVLDGTPRVYDIRGSAPHPHFVEVTAADFELLARNLPVVKESSIDGDAQFPLHSHTVRLVCA